MDFDKLAAQAMQMQQELQRVQEEAAKEHVTASAGSGRWARSPPPRAARSLRIEIDPAAIDPDDPELLADIVTAAVEIALRVPGSVRS